MSDFQRLSDKARAFAEARDWDKFHSPKNLTMALGGEVSELLDLFQWLTEAQAYELTPEQQRAAAHEIADVQIYLLLLAYNLGVVIPIPVYVYMSIN